LGKRRIQPNYRRRTLRLPDLDHSKLAVLNSLGSPGSRRVYEYALDQVYCVVLLGTAPRLQPTGFKIHAVASDCDPIGPANTIDQQQAAVRRLAHEAADAGLLSPELAAGNNRLPDCSSTAKNDELALFCAPSLSRGTPASVIHPLDRALPRYRPTKSACIILHLMV
jgi:hypothetical protein